MKLKLPEITKEKLNTQLKEDYEEARKLGLDDAELFAGCMDKQFPAWVVFAEQLTDIMLKAVCANTPNHVLDKQGIHDVIRATIDVTLNIVGGLAGREEVEEEAAAHRRSKYRFRG